jgi:hypothetical protein
LWIKVDAHEAILVARVNPGHATIGSLMTCENTL